VLLSVKEALRIFRQQYGINSSKNKYWILDSKLKSSLGNNYYCKIKAEAAEILKTINLVLVQLYVFRHNIMIISNY
jgi:hypothetical protein